MFERSLGILLIAALQVLAQRPATMPATTPAPGAAATDICTGVIDPYDQGVVRTGFLKAAGVDNELTADEFAADAAAGGGFARKFDSWGALLKFDKNKNGTIDWPEAEEYRQDLRKRVLAAFDADSNGKLNGSERDDAAVALAAGRIPAGRAVAVARGTMPAGVGGPNDAKQSLASRPDGGVSAVDPNKYDKDGDGTLNEEERRAMRDDVHEALRKSREARFDKNKDGVLDDEEKAALVEEETKNMPKAVRTMVTRMFDSDGDGKLSYDDWRAVEEAGPPIQKMAEGWMNRVMDADGDGKVSDKERQAAQAAFAAAVPGLMAKFEKQMDTNGDGTISNMERRAFEGKMQGNIIKMIDGFVKKVNPDPAKPVTAEQRQQVFKLINEDVQGRFRKADANGDGKVTPDEAIKLFEALAEEVLAM